MASFADAPPPSSPYLIHPSDSPSLILVSGHLTGDNFPKWQCALCRALNAKNKLCFVDGTLKAPSNTSTDYAQWSRTKDMVLTWILNTITPSLANSLDYHDDPRDEWLNLESRFCHGNNARLFHLKREISNLHQNQLSIPDYYNNINQLWDELSNLQTPTDANTLEKRAEDERVFQFLLGLKDSFAALRTQILATASPTSQQSLLHSLPRGTTASPTSSPIAIRHPRHRCWLIIGYPLGREPRNNRKPSILANHLLLPTSPDLARAQSQASHQKIISN